MAGAAMVPARFTLRYGPAGDAGFVVRRADGPAGGQGLVDGVPGGFAVRRGVIVQLES